MSTYITKRAKDLDLAMVDAKAPLALEVTAGNVSAAQRKNSKCCAFSRAACELPGVERAYFFRSTAWLEYQDKLVRYTLPPSAQKEIVSFDRSRVFAPGVYQLSQPAKSQTLGAALARSKKRPGRHQPGNTKIKRKFLHRTSGVRALSEPSWVPLKGAS